MAWLFTFFFSCCRAHFKTYVLNYMKIYFMMVHWKKGNLEDKISQHQQIWHSVIIMFLYSEVCVLFCVCMFDFGVGKDKKGTLSIKIMHQTNSGLNQNENESLFIFTGQKKWGSANTGSVKFLIYTRFSSFLCLYSSSTMKHFTSKYPQNFEWPHWKYSDSWYFCAFLK